MQRAMGAYISKWRRKPSTVEVLEKLEKDIVRLERSKQSDTERQKQIVASLLLYSILLYIISALAFYFYFMPTLWFDRICYSLPLLIFPLLVWFLKRFLHWYFVKRIKTNDEALEKLKLRKKEILEEVMEKETYKKAKEILEKFGATVPAPVQETPTAAERYAGEQLRQRIVHPGGGPRTPSPAVTTSPSSNYGASPVLNMQAMQQRNAGQFVNATPMRFPPPGPPLPRPVLPRERTVLDRLMEHLLGDGPQNRYALICSECSSHNGMALREEFEFICFRCCYCFHVNPARKQKPKAPSLDLEQHQSVLSTVEVNDVEVDDVETTALETTEIDSEECLEGRNSASEMEVDDAQMSKDLPVDNVDSTETDGSKKND